MPRQNKFTVEESHAAEISADDRRRNRATGFAKMHERDRSFRRLSNGSIIHWPVNRELDEYEARLDIPEGMFALTIDGKEHYFDTDEFRQWLRWA